jgi:Mce-associated membrane protein
MTTTEADEQDPARVTDGGGHAATDDATDRTDATDETAGTASATGTAGGTGAAAAAAVTAAGGGSAADGGTGTAARRRWPLRAGWALVALLCAAGAVMLTAAHRTTDHAAGGNRALTDAAATQQVIGEVSDGLGRIFSYSPGTLDQTRQAAGQVLTGKAAQQYATLFAQVQRQVPTQHLTLTSHVVRAGVSRLTGTTAHLVVFLDQTSQRTGGKTAEAAAQISVTAEQHGGHWQITDITTR